MEKGNRKHRFTPPPKPASTLLFQACQALTQSACPWTEWDIEGKGTVTPYFVEGKA